MNETDGINMTKIENEPSPKDIEMAEYYAELEEQLLNEKPKVVFKYKSVSSAQDLARLCDIFQNQRIYMPNLDQLNDPLESANSRLLGISEEERKAYFKDYRVLSLSANPMLPTLWAYYADNYQGVCLGFKTRKNFFDIKKVTYHKSHDAISWGLNENDLLKKSEAWQHESEYRIIRNSKGSNYFRFDADDLACVIFGCNMEKGIREHIETVLPIAIPIFTVKTEPSKFCLVAEYDDTLFNFEEIIEKIK